MAGIARRELLLRWWMNHRRPITGRIDFRRLLRSWRILHLKLHVLAPRRIEALRVLQPVTTHPQLIGSVRQIRHQEPALIIRNDNFAKGHGERLGFRDHPNSRFRLRAVAIKYDATDAILIDWHSGSVRDAHSRALPAHCRPRRYAKNNQKGPQHRARYGSHLSPPMHYAAASCLVKAT